MILLLIFIVLIVVIINRQSKVDDLEKKIKELTKQINEQEAKIEVSKVNLNDTGTNLDELAKKPEEADAVAELKEPIAVSTSSYKAESKETKEARISDAKVKVKKPKVSVKNDEGIKNKYILMIGAVLIILAAVVFLTSTWRTIPDLLKSIVIMMLAGVFFGASNIAKKTFKLEDTARTFLYIGLAYVPIALFSLSFFELIGPYFSIHGDGKFIYYALVTLLLSITYYHIGNKQNIIALIHASLVMQYSTSLFVALSINRSVEVMFVGLLVYNAILLLLKNNVFKKYEKIIYSYSRIGLYLISAYEVGCILFDNTLITFTSMLLLLVNFFLEYKKDMVSIISILVCIILTGISGVRLMQFSGGAGYNHLVFTLLVLGVFGIGVVPKNPLLKKSTVLVTVPTMLLNCCYILAMSSRIAFLIDIVIALWIVFGMNIVSYVILPKNRNTLIHLILLTLYCAIFCTFEKYFNNLIYLILATIAIFIASHLKQFKDPNRSSTVKIYTNATLGISLFLGLFYNTVNNANVEFYINNYWIIAVVVASYVLAFVKTKFKGYKIIAYLFLNILLYLMAQKYELHSLEPYIIGITTLGIALLDLARKELSDDVNKLYLLCSYILSCLILSINTNIWQFIMMIVLTVLFYAYKKRRNINRESIGAIPLVVFIPSIYLSEWITIGTFNPMIIASIILIAITTMLSISKKELSVYLIISALYIVMQYSTLLKNDYLLWIMLAVWSFLHIRSMKDNKFIFRVLLYVSCLLIYLKALTDINLLTNNLLKFNALNYLGFIVFGILLLRNVVKDLFKDYKLLEYAYFAILYLYALINYINEIDGMIFVFFVIVFVIYSYKKKYGPAFFTSGVAIVVNAFMLTRTFWFSIPWWIYMLVVGSALIVFAVKNELNEQKHRKMLKDKVKAFKDYMDM